jgi:5-methylcytosine-specific restriction endonuclease McrA
LSGRDPDAVARANAELRAKLAEDAASGRENDYRTGPHWRRLRLALIALVGEQCEECGAGAYEYRGPAGTGGPLEVHHKHYESIGEEWLGDVELLCRDCHELRPRWAPKNTAHWWRTYEPFRPPRPSN